MRVSVMLQAVTLSTCSWASELHGQWQLSIIDRMEMTSTCRLESEFYICLTICSIKINFFFHSLAFSVTLFCSEALIAILILLLRRSKAVGGELGGPKVIKYITATALIGLWVVYLVMSSLEAYGVIKFGAQA